MAPIRVVTDSTADLPQAMQRELGISVVPLNVHFGEQTYHDQVEISAEAFFERLPGAASLPRTSQPAPGDFLKVYEPLVAEGGRILSIHLSAKLSGTFQSATMAAGMLPTGDISLLDSTSVSWGMGFQVLGAARLAAQGASLEEILAFCTGVQKHLHVFFGLQTLEYLHKNGRIGAAQAFVGGLVGIKPILAIREGVVQAVDKVRGKSKVLPRILELAAERVPPGRSIHLAVVHGAAPEEARVWLDAMAGQYKLLDSSLTSVGPVIGCHTGPGVVGMLFYEDF